MSERIIHQPTSIIEKQYKRLLEQLEIFWGHPEQFDNAINRIMLDDRGDRAGFPIEVWAELNYLQLLHKSIYQRVSGPGHVRTGKNF